ncbi:MAG: alpha/beta hydrolase [Ignavibacteriae bacterium]|nr:alpha/beta hydrolase [Ignavibacteriota bacterium]
MIKINHKIILIFLSLFILSCNSIILNSSAEKKRDVLTKYTELKTFYSQEVSDSFYLYIRVPKNYENENKNYPVLYLLDGDISFNMATSIVRYLQYGNDVPEIIIVGIGYGSMINDEKINFRERDYTFSKNDLFKQSGGGINFLNFIKKELIPFVDKNYKTNDVRILNGFSLGGLFTTYTLLKEKNLFSSYIAGSPYLKSDIDSLLKITTGFENFDGKLFITFGELESEIDYKIPIKNLVDELHKNVKNETKIKLQIFENGTHFTTPAEALTYGLKFIFDEN